MKHPYYFRKQGLTSRKLIPHYIGA
jgi:hypothetical protein